MVNLIKCYQQCHFSNLIVDSNGTNLGLTHQVPTMSTYTSLATQFLSLFAFGSVSMLMTIALKIMLTSFSFPSIGFVATCQMVSSLSLMLLLYVFGKLSIQNGFSMKAMKTVRWIESQIKKKTILQFPLDSSIGLSQHAQRVFWSGWNQGHQSAHVCCPPPFHNDHCFGS